MSSQKSGGGSRSIGDTISNIVGAGARDPQNAQLITAVIEQAKPHHNIVVIANTDGSIKTIVLTEGCASALNDLGVQTNWLEGGGNYHYTVDGSVLSHALGGEEALIQALSGARLAKMTPDGISLGIGGEYFTPPTQIQK